MKTYKNLYRSLIDKNYIKSVILSALNGKKYKNRKFKNIDYYTEETYKSLVNRTYQILPTETIAVNERGKDRNITTSPFYPNKVFDYLIVDKLAPIILKSMYYWCIGNVKGKGKDRGIDYIRNKSKHYKYAIKLDIKKFYDNIDKSILFDLIKRKVSDNDFLNFYIAVIGNTGRGIPLGLNSSQWLSNYYLQDLDYYIKQELKAKVYVRYVDDMVILGNNKRKLHSFIRKIKEYLEINFNLTLKENYQLLNLTRNDFIDFLGYRIYSHKIKLRKKIFYKFVKLYRRMKKPSKKRAKTIVSLYGWFKKSTHSYRYYKKYLLEIMPFKNIRKGVFNYDYN